MRQAAPETAHFSLKLSQQQRRGTGAFRPDDLFSAREALQKPPKMDPTKFLWLDVV
jgi:hypothetical protein